MGPHCTTCSCMMRQCQNQGALSDSGNHYATHMEEMHDQPRRRTKSKKKLGVIKSTMVEEDVGNTVSASSTQTADLFLGSHYGTTQIIEVNQRDLEEAMHQKAYTQSQIRLNKSEKSTFVNTRSTTDQRDTSFLRSETQFTHNQASFTTTDNRHSLNQKVSATNKEQQSSMKVEEATGTKVTQADGNYKPRILIKKKDKSQMEKGRNDQGSLSPGSGLTNCQVAKNKNDNLGKDLDKQSNELLNYADNSPKYQDISASPRIFDSSIIDKL